MAVTKSDAKHDTLTSGCLSTDNPRRWDSFWRRRAAPTVDPDATFKIWKKSWVEGANARWAGVSSSAGPHTWRFSHAAWDAGWSWAGQNPDRRKATVLRLAHRRRRATDVPSRLPRLLKMGALGIAVYGVSRSVQMWVRPRRDDQ